MARGREKHQARQQAIGLLGKDLARRAKRRCELCEAQDDLRPYDTAPDEEPELDALILLCARCRGLMGGATADPRTLRFLEGAVWNEVPAVAEAAKGLLANVDADWARDTLEMF